LHVLGVVGGAELRGEPTARPEHAPQHAPAPGRVRPEDPPQHRSPPLAQVLARQAERLEPRLRVFAGPEDRLGVEAIRLEPAIEPRDRVGHVQGHRAGEHGEPDLLIQLQRQVAQGRPAGVAYLLLDGHDRGAGRELLHELGVLAVEVRAVAPVLEEPQVDAQVKALPGLGLRSGQGEPGAGQELLPGLLARVCALA